MLYPGAYKRVNIKIVLDTLSFIVQDVQLQIIYVTLDHKTSHKCQFFDINIYTSTESWINKLSVEVSGLLGSDHFWLKYNYLKIWVQKIIIMRKSPINLSKLSY